MIEVSLNTAPSFLFTAEISSPMSQFPTSSPSADNARACVSVAYEWPGNLVRGVEGYVESECGEYFLWVAIYTIHRGLWTGPSSSIGGGFSRVFEV